MVSNGKLMAFINALGGAAPAPSEVVILPETELTVEEDLFSLTTPWTVAPVVGGVYIVTYNGTVYECEALDAAEMSGVPGSTIMGRTSLANISGGNEDAPFVILAYPNDSEAGAAGVYGEFRTADGATSVTLSIVQVGAASGGESAGGGVLMINVSFDTEDLNNYSNPTKDKSYAEIKAAYDAGAMLYCKVTIRYNGEPLNLSVAPLVLDSFGKFVFRIPYGVLQTRLFDIDQNNTIGMPHID